MKKNGAMPSKGSYPADLVGIVEMTLVDRSASIPTIPARLAHLNLPLRPVQWQPNDADAAPRQPQRWSVSAFADADLTRMPTRDDAETSDVGSFAVESPEFAFKLNDAPPPSSSKRPSGPN